MIAENKERAPLSLSLFLFILQYIYQSVPERNMLLLLLLLLLLFKQLPTYSLTKIEAVTEAVGAAAAAAAAAVSVTLA